MEAPEYSYTSLTTPDSIRLLVLNPSKDTNEDPVCKIREIQLKNPSDVDFEALSYTWGPLVFDQDLYLGRSRYKVTKSLHSALRYLRFPDKPRVIWVDAICINQNDNAEKSQQLELMATIYKTASCVLVWLGVDNGSTTKIAFQVASCLHDTACALNLPSLEPGLSDVIPTKQSRFRDDLFHDHDSSFKDTVQRLDTGPLISVLARDWFSRTWTIQEIILADRAVAHCGHQSIGWEALATAAYILLRVFILCYNPGDPAVGAQEKVSIQNAGACALVRSEHYNRQYLARLSPEDEPEHKIVSFRDICSYAYEFRARGCGDDRDRIFALMSMQISPRSHLRADYTCSVEEVYTEFTREALRAGYTGILDYAGLGYRDLSNVALADNTLPSWALELRLSRLPILKELFHTLGLVPGLPWGYADTYWPAQPQIQVSQDRHRIYLMGLAVDQVNSANFKFRSRPNHENDGRTLVAAEWITLCLMQLCKTHSLNEKYPAGVEEFNLEAFARTMTADGCFSIEANRVKRRCDPTPHILGEVVKYLENSSSGSPNCREDLKQYLEFAYSVYIRCAFYCTNGGLMGLGPPITRPGDIIVKFEALLWPTILRPVPDSEDYQILGQCYLHGYMLGDKKLEGTRKRYSIV
ncbi:heterokaryon incompatibility protein-domain-containing protein [Lophiotrema nucula]|uniref:Heterokaryon incompatibility protein-domain-containing protein n=1 Tax=Lophiotrema nucula TaxID=690887 RepID=A0A6A5Z7M6_9PLEO|nr:heterokaryon incompatibility protein-domain-containing protein [Lophiotrema nucula]